MVDLSLHGKEMTNEKKKKTMTNLQSPPYEYLNHNVHEQVALHLKKWTKKHITNFIGKLKAFKTDFDTSDFAMECLNLHASPCLQPPVLW